MFTTIRLDALLQEAHPARAPRNLVTRPTGVAVRASIERELARRHATVALLDFSELDLVDLSCADEVVAKLLQRLELEPGRHVALTGLTEDQAEAIDHVLTHHHLGIQAAVRDSTRPRLLGSFGEDCRAAFEVIVELGWTECAPVAERLGWRMERLTDALQVLCLLGVVMASDGAYRAVMVA